MKVEVANCPIVNWEELIGVDNYSWAWPDFAEINNRESLFSIINNCKNYLNEYEYQTLEIRKKIKESVNGPNFRGSLMSLPREIRIFLIYTTNLRASTYLLLGQMESGMMK